MNINKKSSKCKLFEYYIIPGEKNGSVAQWQSIRLQIERSVVQIRSLLFNPKYHKKINIAWSRENHDKI